MSTPSSLLVFVNEHATTVVPPATVLSAVRSQDPALADALAVGRAYVTDGRGIRLDSDGMLEAGAILRVIVSARRPESDADA